MTYGNATVAFAVYAFVIVFVFATCRKSENGYEKDEAFSIFDWWFLIDDYT